MTTERKRMGFIIIFMATPIILLIRGYFFPNGNHGQEIPPIMAIINPELFRGDFAIQSYLLPGVRFYYQEFIAILVGQFGMGFSIAYLTLYLITIISFITGIFYIATFILKNINTETSDKTSLIFFVGLLLYILAPFYSWGSDIIPIIPNPSAFAMGISVWGIYYAIQNKWIHSFSIFGLAAIMQFLVGFLPALIFSASFLRYVIKNKSWTIGTLSIIALCIGLSLVYIPMSIYTKPAPADFDMISIFGLYRVPHHWAPSTGNFEMWLSDLSFMVSGIIISIDIYENKNTAVPIRNIASICSLAILIGSACVFANYVFVEIYPVTLIGKLQFQRIIPFAHLSVIILLFIYSHELWIEKQYGLLASIFFAPLFMLWGVIVLSIVLLYRNQSSIGRLSQWSALGFSLFITPLLLYFWHILTGVKSFGIYGLSSSLSNSTSHILLAIFLYIAVLLLTSDRKIINTFVLSILFIATYIIFALPIMIQARILKPQLSEKSSINKVLYLLNNRLQFDATNKIPLYSLAVYLRNNTSIDESVMLPPVGPFDRFQLVSQRSAYFVHKNVPYSEYHVWEWANRDSNLLGTKIKPFMTEKERILSFSKRNPKELSDIAKAQGISYIISRVDWHKNMPGLLIKTDIYQEELWGLWRLSSN